MGGAGEGCTLTTLRAQVKKQKMIVTSVMMDKEDLAYCREEGRRLGTVDGSRRGNPGVGVFLRMLIREHRGRRVEFLENEIRAQQLVIEELQQLKDKTAQEVFKDRALEELRRKELDDAFMARVALRVKHAWTPAAAAKDRDWLESTRYHAEFGISLERALEMMRIARGGSP